MRKISVLFGLAAAGVLSAQPRPVAVDVDPSAERRPIDPRIYGVNFGESPQIEELRYPLRRWGGNATTRYNWRVDVSNRAADYFFQNIANPDPGTLPHGSEADRFIDSTRQNGGEALLSVPLIGWTPTGEDRQKRWGFSVASYGSQDLVECDLYDPPPFWCSEDAGNGECSAAANGTGFCVDGLIVGNDPADTSEAVDASFVSDWMAHVAGRVGSASAGGVRLFALDNEPMLWDSTHRDVHPAPVSYDEAWTRTVDVASAIKAADGAAEVLGPVVWGWCAFFTSAADAAGGFCLDGPDRQAHGGLPFLAWYLEQVCQHEAVTGVRLVDYLDVHFYPQGHVAGLGGASDGEDAATAARRLRSIKELYDPSYVSESWIGQPVFLIPRMRDWIDQHCPGVGLALSEYKWGPDDGPSGALAQAEVLAVFGREGVDVASRWVAPQPGTRSEDAFRLYLSYDGNGARVAGESVRATTSDVDAVGAYAVRAAGEALYVLLFNKDTVDRDVDVTVVGGLGGTIDVYGFDAAQRLGFRGTAAADGAGFSLTLPARSATLAVAQEPGVFADGFESGDTSAWSAALGRRRLSSRSRGSAAERGTLWSPRCPAPVALRTRRCLPCWERRRPACSGSGLRRDGTSPGVALELVEAGIPNDSIRLDRPRIPSGLRTPTHGLRCRLGVAATTGTPTQRRKGV